MTVYHLCVALVHILNPGTYINEWSASRIGCCAHLKRTYIPTVLVEVWAKRITIRDQNVLTLNYKNQGMGNLMEAILFVFTIKHSTYIQCDIVQTVHCNWLYEESNKILLFVCVYSKICTLHVSNGYTVHHQKFTYHCVCSCLYISC